MTRQADHAPPGSTDDHLPELFGTLASVSARLSRKEILDRVVRAARSFSGAGYASFALVGPDGQPTEVVEDGSDGTAAVEARLPRDDDPLDELLRRSRSASAEQLQSLATPDDGPAAPDGGAAVTVPVRQGDEPIGSLSVSGKECGACFTEADQQILVALAAVTGAALHNARVLEQAERRQQALTALHGISAALLGGAQVEDVLSLMAHRAAELVEADAASITVLAPEGDRLSIRAATGGEFASAVVGAELPVAGTVQGGVVTSGRAAFLEDVSVSRESVGPVGDHLDVGPWISVPLWFEGRPHGTLSLVRLTGRDPFEPAHLPLVETFAAQASVALNYGAAQRRAVKIADTLRNALLPPELPTVVGVDLAARYRPQTADIGGDFYDLFPLRGAAWALAIGDISGSGPEAATWTSLARHTLRTAAMADRRPDRVLRTLNEALCAQGDETRFCTGIFGHFKLVKGSVHLTLARAGHPYPLVVRGDGSAFAVRPPGDLLGLFESAELTPETIVLGPGDALVLYTDGVTEARSGRGQFGPERLLRLVQGMAGQPAAVIADAVTAAVNEYSDRAGDDLAVLVLAVPTGAGGPRG